MDSTIRTLCMAMGYDLKLSIGLNLVSNNTLVESLIISRVIYICNEIFVYTILVNLIFNLMQFNYCILFFWFIYESSIVYVFVFI